MRRRLLLFAFCLLPSAFCLSGCTPLARPAAEDLDNPVGDFSLTERSGRTITREDLLGKIWVASFIFTRCAGPCPQVTGNMARLQAQLAGDDGVMLVTFTVDPKYDTPKVLRTYAAHYGADPKRWLFLTGDQDKLYALIRNSFMSAVEQTKGAARTPGNEVTHSTRLFLVDRKGHVRAYFDGREVDDLDGDRPINTLPQVRQRIAELEREN
ncbi:MAG TPA: SCO family protein [Gemmataceae bacterium]|jgi:cytochrome oxidase Cu insertion factor (SCO1/SenC/PrrC family)|nr:SCO family protein [Gemmataceae bacterium]